MKRQLGIRSSSSAVSKRLSSPDHLTQVIEVTSHKLWIALLGVLLLLGVSCAWGTLGRVPTTVTTQGMVVRIGGVLPIMSRGAGMITKLTVQVGQKIHKGEVIATIAQPILVEKIQAMKESLSKTEVDRAQALAVRTNESRLRVVAADQQEEILAKDITELEQQASAAADQVNVQNILFKDGIVPKQQVLTAEQHLTDVRGQLADRHARLKQLDVDRVQYRAEPFTSDPQFNTRIQDLQSSIREAERELRLDEEVSSLYDGEVVEMKASEGMSVAVNAPILTIQREATDLNLITYVPAPDAKTITPGMEVQISPSTIKREEYGYIRGSVNYVFAYPATPAALMREFENESFVSSLTSGGPVTEIHVGLKKNPKTVSGLLWSSSAGPPITITSGTICTADVITRKRSPFTIAFRFLERHSGLN